MTQLEEAQKIQLKSLLGKFKQLQKQLDNIHKKSGYEDLGQGVLTLQIAQHAVEETLEHTGLERFNVSPIPKHTARRSSGRRS